ncbi:hypothetical protein ACU4GA_19105 [Methylobacterium oryzae CBMB20]
MAAIGSPKIWLAVRVMRSKLSLGGVSRRLSCTSAFEALILEMVEALVEEHRAIASLLAVKQRRACAAAPGLGSLEPT